MENDSGFPGTQLPWQPSAADFSGTVPLGFELQQCLLQQFDSGLGPIARLDGFGSLPLLPHQWSSSCLPLQGLNSTPKLNLSTAASPSFGAEEPAFAEIAARMPGFALNYAGKFPLYETGRLHGGVDCRNDGSRTSRSSGAGDGELRGLPAESSASDHTANDGNGRKRKSTKAGEESGKGSRKRSRVAETSCGGGKDAVKPKLEVAGAGEEQKPDVAAGKAAEAPKQDYIHVRARRGQATDAHSLAERVRREKISERMKFLQNLVPGCNKVTGKAVMLDEIINYVQCLQRQVEFLSMKLATVNPRLEIDVENILQKDMMHPPVYPMEAPPAFPFANPSLQAAPLQNIASSAMESHCSSNPLNLMLPRRPLAVQPPLIHGLSADTGSQVAAGFWGDDLHRVVQMGSGQSQEDIKIKL